MVAKTAVNQMLYDGLTVLQHRGQDAAGIATYEDGRLYLRKSNGLVRDVFHTRHMVNLRGRMGIGHVRYPTAGVSSTAEAQLLERKRSAVVSDNIGAEEMKANNDSNAATDRIFDFIFVG